VKWATLIELGAELSDVGESEGLPWLQNYWFPARQNGIPIGPSEKE
jgi:hypothetical protein